MAQEHQAVTLGDLAADGQTLTPEEAVALTLAVAERLGWSEPPRQPELIVVRSDGTVHLPRAVAAAPALPGQYADLLHWLLSLGRGDAALRVPGPLLLLIARARGEIDLPAFASADEFRHALVRLLSRPGAHVITAGMARWRPAPIEASPAPPPERRTTGPRVDELRRMLRESDLERIALRERLRQQSVPASRPDAPAPRALLTGTPAHSPVRRRAARGALAAAFAASSIAAGGLLWGPRGATAPSVAQARVAKEVESPAGHATPASAHSAAPIEAGAAQTADDAAQATARPIAGTHAKGPALSRTTAGARGNQDGTSPESAARFHAARPVGQPAPGPTGRLHTLPVAAAAAFSPSFSPDGESVYFHSEGRDGSRLMRADTDDRGDVREVATIVDDGAQNFHVRLSPDGSRVAFDSDRDGVRGIYVAGRDGVHVRRVSGPGYAAVPVWSPDGRELLYIGAEPRAPRTWNLWRLSLDSGAAQQLTFHRHGQSWPGSWFGDGERICYTHEDRMYVLDLRTGRSQSIRSPVAGRLVRTAAVSPNGIYVVFQVYRDGMWLLDLRDRSMRRVLQDPTAEEFTWSPDGRRIAFHSRRQGHWGVWVMASPS